MRLLIVCALFVMPLYASAKTGIEANSADYDGKKISMAGSVYIQHEFGNIRCEKGVLLMKPASDKRFDPDRIMLSGAVEVTLHDGSILTSDDADIDCKTLEGVFTANAPQKVVYITRVEEEGNAVPVKTMSRAMRVVMKKEEGDKSSYVIQDIQAEGAVNIEYQVGK